MALRCVWSDDSYTRERKENKPLPIVCLRAGAIQCGMSFKVGDPVELDAIVRGMFPQDDGLLVALEVPGYGRLSLHDRWLRRTAAGPLTEGEEVTFTGKVASIRDKLAGIRVDGSLGVIIAWTAAELRRPS